MSRSLSDARWRPRYFTQEELAAIRQRRRQEDREAGWSEHVEDPATLQMVASMVVAAQRSSRALIGSRAQPI